MKIFGLNELVSGLVREAAGAVPAASAAVTKVSQAVKNTAISIAPRGPTGDLKASIGVSAPNRTTRIVAPDVRYANFVEYGTYKDAPQPYMGPAGDQHDGELATELERLVGNL